MTATDELRRLLDERGVEHYDGTESTLWGYESYNEVAGIYRYSADESSSGYMQVRLYHATPEQAIAATLGSGTCRYELKDGWYECSNCGRSMRAYEGRGDPLDPPNFCPDCGRRVE